MSNGPESALDYETPPPGRNRVVRWALVAVVGLGILGALLSFVLFGVSTTQTVVPTRLMPVAPTTAPAATTLPVTAGS